MGRACDGMDGTVWHRMGMEWDGHGIGGHDRRANGQGGQAWERVMRQEDGHGKGEPGFDRRRYGMDMGHGGRHGMGVGQGCVDAC